MPDKEADEPSSGVIFISTANVVDKAMRRVAKRETSLDNDGKFRIERVRPGAYELQIFGPGITAGEFRIAVAANDLEVGILKVRGTGRIVGRASAPYDETDRAPWPFVRGEIIPADVPGRIEFITDEDGRFTVQDAPVGRVNVAFHYMISADVGGLHSRKVQVVEGRESQVWFAPPPGTPDVPLEFIVGDGSEAHRLAGLGLRKSRPAEKDDSSPWEDPHLGIEITPPEDVSAAIPPTTTCRIERPGVTPLTVRGIPKGHCRLHVTAYSTEPLFERELNVTDTTAHAPPIRVRLSPASIIGTVEPAGGRTSVYAVPENQKRPLQIEDVFGDTWAFRFVADGKYTVLARDPDRGWARAENQAVAAGTITDAGTLRFSPGGVIQGRITLPPRHGVLGSVTATDSRGLEVSVSPGSSFRIPNLWPGQWTVSLFDRSGDHVLGTGTATIAATETVSCDLAFQP